jgi:hypothetical protein
MITLINVIGYYDTNDFPKEQLESILANPEEVRSRIIGSIRFIPLEQCMLLSIWGIKICVLGFAYRLRRAYYISCRGFVSHCHEQQTNAPNSQGCYLRRHLCCIFLLRYRDLLLSHLMPTFRSVLGFASTNPQCATHSTYAKMYMVFNISSDLMIMVMAILIICRSQLPITHQIALIGVFCLGVFTIVAAVLNK